MAEAARDKYQSDRMTRFSRTQLPRRVRWGSRHLLASTCLSTKIVRAMCANDIWLTCSRRGLTRGMYCYWRIPRDVAKRGGRATAIFAVRIFLIAAYRVPLLLGIIVSSSVGSLRCRGVRFLSAKPPASRTLESFRSPPERSVEQRCWQIHTRNFHF